MALSTQDHDIREAEDSQTDQWYGVREATMFVVDATHKMFEVDPDTNLNHIQKFLKVIDVLYILNVLTKLYEYFKLII